MPYLGVPNQMVFHANPDFSTGKGTYPQKSAGYPQSAYVIARMGGFPCPLNIGVLLWDYERFLEKHGNLIHK
jgi:hypothetical protein